MEWEETLRHLCDDTPSAHPRSLCSPFYSVWASSIGAHQYDIVLSGAVTTPDACRNTLGYWSDAGSGKARARCSGTFLVHLLTID